MEDSFARQYEELLDGCYDCVDRIVLNAYVPKCGDGGGFRVWWRSIFGSDDRLDNTHLMRMAGRFSRRLRAWARAKGVPVVECTRHERKHRTVEDYLAHHTVESGLFLILVGRAPAPVWEVKKNREGKITNIKRKEPWPYVQHYYFHIMDPDWGHLTIRMSGHPPFPAQVILNGHEYVACQARARKGKPIEFRKKGNCFTYTSNALGLKKVADTLRSPDAAGLLKKVCERWIYTSCLCFAIDLEEQNRSGFHYEYSSYQVEYSRNLQFRSGGQMEQVFQAVIDRTRTPLDLDQVKTIFGYKKRPWRTKLSEGRYEAAIEKPGYSLTVFKVHYGKLTLKIYTKGESTLRIEVIVHNTLELPRCRPLERFANVIERLRAIIEKFLETVHSIDVCFVADATLEQLPTATRVGKSKVGGIDYNQGRVRLVMQAVLALAASPKGFTASEIARHVRQSGPPGLKYQSRQASYDLKKLRGKKFVRKIQRSHRYEPISHGLRAMTALLVLRDKVIRPLLAASCHPQPQSPVSQLAPIDRHYRALQLSMNDLFRHLGIAA